MAIWKIDFATYSAELKNDFICHTVCKFNEEDYLSERDSAVFNLFSLSDTVSSREYEVLLNASTPTVFELTADIDAAVLTFGVDAVAFDVVSANSYISIGDENMVVQSVDEAAGTITVYARGHGTSAAAGHIAADEIVSVMGRAENYCTDDASCTIYKNGGKILNAVQRHSACTTWCEEDLCHMTEGMDSCRAEKFLGDYKNKAIINARVKTLKSLDRIALKGTYQSWDNAQGTAGTTRGLREFAYGITTSTGDMVSGIKFDASDVADNACATTSTDLSYVLLQSYFDKVDMVEGFHDIMIVSPKTRQALRDVVLTCQESCDAKNSAGEQSAFRNVSYVDAPFGRIEVIVSSNVSDTEILFAARRNLKIHPYCFTGAAIFDTKEFETQNGTGNWKYKETGYFSFDASQNMCDELGVLHSFTIGANC